MAPDLSFLLSTRGYLQKKLHFVSITNCNCFKVCLEEFQISFSFICTHIEIKYFNEASLVNLHYLCFLYYLLAKKIFFIENLAKITTLNYCGSFWMHFFKFQGKKKRNAIHQPGSVCIGKNCALCLEYCPWLCYPRPEAQFFSIQTSCLANNIYLLYKLLCCTRMSNPQNSHNSTLVKSPFFSTCLISPISCWHINRFLHQSVRLMNEPG